MRRRKGVVLIKFTPDGITPLEYEFLISALCYEFDRCKSLVPESFRKDKARLLRHYLRFEDMHIRQGNDGSRFADVKIEREHEQFWFEGCVQLKESARDRTMVARCITSSFHYMPRWSILGFIR